MRDSLENQSTCSYISLIFSLDICHESQNDIRVSSYMSTLSEHKTIQPVKFLILCVRKSRLKSRLIEFGFDVEMHLFRRDCSPSRRDGRNHVETFLLLDGWWYFRSRERLGIIVLSTDRTRKLWPRKSNAIFETRARIYISDRKLIRLFTSMRTYFIVLVIITYGRCFVGTNVILRYFDYKWLVLSHDKVYICLNYIIAHPLNPSKVCEFVIKKWWFAQYQWCRDYIFKLLILNKKHLNIKWTRTARQE